MAKIYYDLIKANLKSIDNVPLRWRADVQALLDEDTAE
ncbi:CD1375 family protein [Paenibacillus antibioticophila]|nr:CD1375 family protein [Paenibacillus antibioticophila]